MKDYLKIPAEVLAIAKGTLCTGSRVVANPPVLDTDLDIVVLVHWGAGQDVHLYLQSEGYEPNENGEYEQDWASPSAFQTYRKGDINLIVLEDTEGFRRWQQATDWAQQLNLRNREDRRMFFNICLYGPERIEFPVLSRLLATPVPQ